MTHKTKDLSTVKSRLRRVLLAAERGIIVKALNLHKDNVSATARYLGVNRTDLYKRMSMFQIERVSYGRYRNRGNAAWRALEH